MISYNNELSDSNGNIYSVDMVRVTFQLRSDKLDTFKHFVENPMRLDIESHGVSTAPFKFRSLFSIHYTKDISLTLGFGFNGSNKDDSLRGFLEFNPNKCYSASGRCRSDVKAIKFWCSDWNVSRWDLAIDVKAGRALANLVKDARMYGCTEKSLENRTEYLGRRSAPGYVKVYNKKLESGLDYDLTRIEITCGALAKGFEEVEPYLPQVFFKSAQLALNLDREDLNQTDAVLLELLLASDSPMYYLRKLSHVKRKKLEPFVLSQGTQLQYDRNIIASLIQYVTTEI